MMKPARSVMALASFLSAVTLACAGVSNPNPNARIEILGNDTALVTTPGQVLQEGFAIRLTDPLGSPLPGITVWFFADQIIVPPVPPPGFVFPPQGLYGKFGGAASVRIVTDAQGIARSGPYTAGVAEGTYNVAVHVSPYDSPTNLAVLVAPPGPGASYAISQKFDVAPIPALSPLALGMLALLVALAGWARVRGHAPRGRRA